MPVQSGQPIFLSKSLFIKGVQCHKALYLHRYCPELKDPVPSSRQAIFDSGHEVGLIARELFPGGVEIPFDAGNYDSQVALTARAIADGAETIYEGAFRHGGIFVKADILHRGESGWEIYEVKSSTGMKDIYQSDVAVQFYVLNGAGIPVTQAFLIHINNQYVRHGAIDPGKIFHIEDVTGSVKKQQKAVREEITAQAAVLEGGTPAIDIGPQCRNPYDCDFIGHCWQHIPEVSVFSLKGNRKLQFSLYSQGIVSLDDVVLAELPQPQRQQVEAYKNQQVDIRRDEIEGFLDTLRYPLCFLDFETFNDAIPRYDGLRPYQHVPYQYSLHYLENESALLKHHEYLAWPGIDPRAELAEKLISEIPGNACVLAYVAGFERGILEGLAEWLPEYADAIRRIIGNMVDLAYPFKNRFLYHWQMNGSYSIKAVLPALVPELAGYSELDIRDGEMAMDAYFRMQGLTDSAEIERIRRALLAYCRLDTFAMVKILEKLREYC